MKRHPSKFVHGPLSKLPYATVKASEWKRMPRKTKLALAEMVKLAGKAQLAKPQTKV